MEYNHSVGAIVKIVKGGDTGPGSNYWSESIGQTGVIIAMAKRLYIPSAKVMVMGEVAEFDLDELEVIG